jgi:hypothetical protein
MQRPTQRIWDAGKSLLRQYVEFGARVGELPVIGGLLELVVILTLLPVLALIVIGWLVGTTLLVWFAVGVPLVTILLIGDALFGSDAEQSFLLDLSGWEILIWVAMGLISWRLWAHLAHDT